MEIGSHFEDGEQEDAAEFLVLLLDALQTADLPRGLIKGKPVPRVVLDATHVGEAPY